NSQEMLGLTTMDAVSLYKTLSNLARDNYDFVALEASSHGVDQGRIGLLKFDVAIFTSFSQDHLDYHKNLEHYYASKLKLFTEHLKPQSLAIISQQVALKTSIEDNLTQHKISYINVGKDSLFSTKNLTNKQEIELVHNGKTYKFSSSIIGSFQLSNLIQAALAVENCGISLNEIVEILPQIKAPKGRLEKITQEDSAFDVFIDYAHTPDALELTLKTLRTIVPKDGRLLVLFGCGGDRDKEKRPIMGQIASSIADVVIITDDNPRSENAKEIRAQILSQTSNAIEIEGREIAIDFIIKHAKTGDVLVIAGKGHENYQIIGDKKYDFSDELEVLKCMKIRNLR
ncbi:MAG: UDP-N-acetylmuramoyl-L-alanyl-D-glutamate--2,6-diaminopimelate ligase, partial [Rickettsiaceae bacterium]|nr:UDP-N-acetylmuramoyl-L-alanyl-D-glutamate--2,6-diaminopimelate ligase [Rickettsiaceae bacterium]